MKQTLFYALLLGGLTLLSTGCKKEPTTPPAEGSATDITLSVTSAKSSEAYEHNQKERSSDNFRTTTMVKGTKLLWSCPEGIEFDVQIDVSLLPDDVFARNLTNNMVTDFIKSDKLYIANPEGADSDFTVTYSVFTPANGEEYVTSNDWPYSDQENRSSSNFHLSDNYSRYQVKCPAGITFKINEDVDNWFDNELYTGVKNGTIIRNPKAAHLYIANPSGAKAPFLITFTPVESIAWMSQVDGNKYLYELSIPGTHDSGTEGVNPGLSKCQNFGIKRQLQDGIRFLDIRLGEDMRVYHGSDYCNISFTDVLNDCNDFLSEHPEEAVLMSIKGETLIGDIDISDEIKAYLNNPNMPVERIYKEEAVPRLDKVRGKIVLFRRFPEPDTASPWGINIYNNWPENTVGTFTNDDNMFYVEDRFYGPLEDDHDTVEKSELMKEGLEKAVGSDYSSHMFLLFNSVAGRVRTPWDYAWGGAGVDPAMNPELSDLLNKNMKNRTAPVRVGTILMDFYNKEGHNDNKHLVEKIINSNFKEDIISY